MGQNRAHLPVRNTTLNPTPPDSEGHLKVCYSVGHEAVRPFLVQYLFVIILENMSVVQDCSFSLADE